MLRFNELSKKEKFKILLNFIIYTLFIIFMINTVNNSNSLSSKLFYLAILIIFLVFALFYEYLRYIQNSIIDLINNKYQIKQAKELINKMQKLDKLNGFKGSYVLFELIIAQEEKNGNKILELLNKNYKNLHTNLDYLLIYRYNQFIAYVLLNNHNQIKKSYQKLIELKNAKIKKSKMAPLYNWEMIDAIYYYVLHDNKKFKQSLKNINTINMNKREKRQYKILERLSYES